MYLPMINDMIWNKSASIGAKISMDVEGSMDTRPNVNLDPIIFLNLRYDQSDMFDVCVMTKICTGLIMILAAWFIILILLV